MTKTKNKSNIEFLFEDMNYRKKKFLQQEMIYLAKQITVNYYNKVLTSDLHCSYLPIPFWQFNGKEYPMPKHRIDIQKAGIIAFPWHKNKLHGMIDAFTIDNKEWKEYHINHKICLVKPLNIYYVASGNHSISAGIIANKKGTLTCSSAIDISDFLKEYKLKGKTIIYDNKKKKYTYRLDELRDLFEIGKLLVK